MTTTKHRVQQINDLPEAAKRPELASVIAMQTTCSVQEAKTILRAAAGETVTGSGSHDSQQQPTAADSDGADVVQLARAMGLKGFAKAND